MNIVERYRFLTLFFCLLWVVACDDKNNKTQTDSNTVKPHSLLSIPPSPSLERPDPDPDEVKTWFGQDHGFIAASAPVKNKIEGLVALGKIQAAALSYRNTSIYLNDQANPDDRKLWRDHASASINADIVNIYASLEPVFKEKGIKPFKATIEALAKPETIEIYTASNTGNAEIDNRLREQKHQITQSSRIISDSVLKAVSVLTPSRKEYMLAGSTMLRLGGNYLLQGLSAEGKITNQSQHQLGISFIHSALNLVPKFTVDLCEQQHQISKAYRDDTYQLAEQLMSYNNKSVQASVSDVYTLANRIEKIANSLPENDADICRG